jgi:hypothetical protein
VLLVQALGSPTGSIVRPAHRLLWPHLRLCRPPAGLWIIPSGCEPVPPATEGPQFTLPVLLTMPLPVLRWLQRLHLTMPSPLILPSPLYHGLGSHNSPTNPDPMGSHYRSCNIRFMLRPGHLLALLRSGLLLPSLLGPGRPSHPSRLSLDGSSSFSIAGLTPAGLSALWAARLRSRLRCAVGSAIASFLDGLAAVLIMRGSIE